MNIAALLIGIVPIIGWGFYPTISTAFGGKISNQIMGSTIGTFIFALAISCLPAVGFSGVTSWGLLFGILSGLGWGFGQIMIFKAFPLIGSSRVMPITVALQLVVTCLWGIVATGNWLHPWWNMLIGFVALAVIIFGAYLTTWTQKESTEGLKEYKKAVLYQIIGVFGYWLYSAAIHVQDIKFIHLNLKMPDNGFAFFLPQAIGMIIAALFYVFFVAKAPETFSQKDTYKQIISGFFFAVAAFTYLVAAQSPENGGLGMATAFVLSQVNVVLATLTGIFILHQEKTPKEMSATIIGLILIVGAAAVTAFL